MFVVACGKKRAATSGTAPNISIPNQPGIAIDGNGQPSSVCSNGACQFVGFTTVTNPNAFALLGGGQYFAEPGTNPGSFNVDLGDSIKDQWDEFRDNCKFGISIGFGGGDVQTGAGFNCDFVNGSGLPVMQGYSSQINYSQSILQIVLQIPSQNGFQYLPLQGHSNGNGRYLAPDMGVQLTPITNGSVVKGFVIQLIHNGIPIEIARTDIGSNF